MTSTPAVVVVSCLQILLRTSFFFVQRGDLCSPAPSLSSWIFLVAFLDLLSDLCIYPMRYMHLPYFCQVMVETLIAILLTEFGAIIVWCTMERVVCRLVKYALLLLGMSQPMYNRWEYWILGVVTTAVSVGILVYVGQATDHCHVMRKKFARLERKLGTSLTKFLNIRFQNEAKSRISSKCYSDYSHSQDYDYDDGLMPSRRRKKRRCL